MRISSGQQAALAPRKCLDTTEEGGGDGRIHIDREEEREEREKERESIRKKERRKEGKKARKEKKR